MSVTLKMRFQPGLVGTTTNQAKTTAFYTGVSNPNIWRMNDRVFVGAAVDNDGGFSLSSPSDWLQTFRNAHSAIQLTNAAQFAVLSTVGLTGLLGASRASDFPTAQSGTIGTASYGLADLVGGLSGATYAQYSEAWRLAGAGIAHVAEGDIANLGSLTRLTPFTNGSGLQGLTTGYWIASGADYVGSQTASVAIGIVNNRADFDRGMVFLAGSVKAYGGFSEAVVMPTSYQIAWHASDGSLGGNTSAQTATLTSIVSDAVYKTTATFADTGFYLQNASGQVTLQVYNQTSPTTNYPILFAGNPANGETAELRAAGPGTNVDLVLRPQGAAGRLSIFTPTTTTAPSAGGAGALPATPAGYATILVNGASRQVPYY